MPSIELRFPQAWYHHLEVLAGRRDQTVEAMILSLISATYPCPRRGLGRHRPIEEAALLARLDEVCRFLDATKSEMFEEMAKLSTRRRGTARAKLKEKREVEGQCLRAALKKHNMTQRELASRLGVHPPNISAVATATVSLPRAWLKDLNAIFGDDWLNR